MFYPTAHAFYVPKELPAEKIEIAGEIEEELTEEEEKVDEKPEAEKEDIPDVRPDNNSPFIDFDFLMVTI